MGIIFLGLGLIIWGLGQVIPFHLSGLVWVVWAVVTGLFLIAGR